MTDSTERLKLTDLFTHPTEVFHRPRKVVRAAERQPVSPKLLDMLWTAGLFVSSAGVTLSALSFVFRPVSAQLVGLVSGLMLVAAGCALVSLVGLVDVERADPVEVVWSWLSGRR